MKKLLFSLSLLASLATIAGESEIDCSAQTFGVLPITTSAQNVIVSVPWVKASSSADSDPIPVADIIKTANLTAGDKVKVWNKVKKLWNVWTLTANAETGILEWIAGDTVTEDGITSGSGADVTTLTRGDALVLHRDTAPTSSYTFYVYGQYCSSAAGATTCALGDASTPAYTLIAPPGTTATDITSTSKVEWDDVGTSDQLSLPDGRSLFWTGSAWGYKTWDKTTKEWKWMTPSCSIAAGTGFWYISRGGSTAATATWK